jgi:hypothetical protein
MQQDHSDVITAKEPASAQERRSEAERRRRVGTLVPIKALAGPSGALNVVDAMRSAFRLRVDYLRFEWRSLGQCEEPATGPTSSGRRARLPPILSVKTGEAHCCSQLRRHDRRSAQPIQVHENALPAVVVWILGN